MGPNFILFIVAGVFMKIYAIEYVWNEYHTDYYAITCKFLSERKKIDESFYYELKKSFCLADKKNNSLQGRYFQTGEI
jgi:hypothetical protein